MEKLPPILELPPSAPAPSEGPVPTPPAPETPKQKHQRAELCYREIEAVLSRFRCRVSVETRPEPIGNDTSRLLLTATWGIIPG